MNINNSDYWQVGLYNLKFGGKMFKNEEATDVFFDSGFSTIQVPEKFYDYMIDYIDGR